LAVNSNFFVPEDPIIEEIGRKPHMLMVGIDLLIIRSPDEVGEAMAKIATAIAPHGYYLHNLDNLDMIRDAYAVDPAIILLDVARPTCESTYHRVGRFAMATDYEREERIVRRAAMLGYALDRLDDGSGYSLAYARPRGRSGIILGNKGGVTLDVIEGWLDKEHPPSED
jgi:hypothetical protein